MITLCAVKDIPDPGAKGFEVEWYEDGERRPLRIIVSRLDDRVFGWINSCPHAGVPLDMEPDKFMDFTGQFLLCSYHGALFALGSGVCLRGPCRGKKLMSVPLVVHDGMVKFNSPSPPLE